MATYIELRGQIEALQKEAESLKVKERAEVIARMKEAIAAFDITAADLDLQPARSAKPTGQRSVLNSTGKSKKKTRAAMAVRYADGAGNTWVGRGKRPQWLKDALAAGNQLEDFAKSP